MAEHAEPVQKTAEPAATRTREADAGSPPQSALLERRSKAALGRATQLLDRRAAAAEASAPRAPTRAAGPQPVQPAAQPNRTGLPDRLKAGVEALAGLSMDDVRVHRNSSEPAKLGALAYARGTDIHLGPGQEPHLPHEAWHVVQQKQGRVRPTGERAGETINDAGALENEAEAMGSKSNSGNSQFTIALPALTARSASSRIIQRVALTDVAVQEALEYREVEFRNMNYDIIRAWDDEWGEDGRNCHGYTVHGDINHYVAGDDLLEVLDPNASVAVFVREGAIGHSGRIVGGHLEHLLIGIGILRSHVSLDYNGGYDTRYNLPAQRHALEVSLGLAEIEEVIDEQQEEEEEEEEEEIPEEIEGDAAD